MQVTIDRNLTPKNCKIRGYVFIGDINYDLEAPALATKEVRLFIKKGYKLGEAGNRNLEQNNFVGLYKPL